MHSHDRTLITRLGFGDLDRKTTAHEAACRFLLDPEIATDLLYRVLMRWVETKDFRSTIRGSRHDPYWGAASEYASSLEMKTYPRGTRSFHLTNNDGSYRDSRMIHIRSTLNGVPRSPNLHITAEAETPITKTPKSAVAGFADVVYHAALDLLYLMEIAERGDEFDDILYSRSMLVRHKWRLVTEVKTKTMLASEILRQINFYRHHWNDESDTFDENILWCLATTYPVGESDRRFFEGANVFVYELGDEFQAWASEQNESLNLDLNL